MKLSNIVIYTGQLLEMKAFYETLGLDFALEKHGRGVEHYYAKLDSRLALELYPLSDFASRELEQESLIRTLRLEFRSGDLALVVQNLIKNGWVRSIGLRENNSSLYLTDPDGNSVVVSSPRFTIKWYGIELVPNP